ncbi:MAG TPA: hypothetical protein VGQ06_02185 [Gemmatimonadales bacterium]|nr:hypothetical protein [Gemmatimonadales bacterium]
MTAYSVAYRLRVYAPRSIDPAEATVLTPAAGAPHSDSFQVSTITGVAGYQPYLDQPRGRNGRINPLDRKLDIGEWTFPLLDKTLASDTTLAGLKRWLSAFLGNVKGQPRLAGLRFEADESLDNGATWTRWGTGRVSRVKVGRVEASLACSAVTDEAKMAVFTGPPHSSITYAARPAVCPIGIFGSDYGTIKQLLPLTGTAHQITVNGIGQVTTSYTHIFFDATSASRRDNLVTRNLLRAVSPTRTVVTGVVTGGVAGGSVSLAELPTFSGTCRARIKHLSGALSGQTGDYRVGGLGKTNGPNGKLRLSAFAIASLAAGDVNQLAVPADGVSVEATLFLDEPVSKSNPLLLNDVHFATLLQDLCDGKFGYLYRAPEPLPAGRSYGDAKRVLPVANSAAFVSDTTYPVQRFVVTKRAALITWVEKNLLRPMNVSLHADTQGRLVISDLRLPTSLAGVPTLTDADMVVDREVGEWSFDREKVITRVEFTRYTDKPLRIEDLEKSGETYPELPSGGVVESLDHPLIVLDVGSTDVGEGAYEVDATGFRSMDGEKLQDQPRGQYLETKLIETANQWRRPFGWGLIDVPVVLKRSSGTALAQGGLVLGAFSHLPDPTTWQRGGTRLFRILELSPEGATRRLTLLDLGLNLFAVAPTLGAPAQEAGNTYTGITTVLTLNASSQPAEVRYAVTDTGVGTVPADTSPLWSVAGRFTSSQTVTIRDLPPNRRIWVQGRTLPDYVDSYLPSAWTNAGAPGRVDTAALPVVSGLSAGTPTHKTAELSWTNGATDLRIEVLLATPTTDPRVRVASLLPGSTKHKLVDLEVSTTYRAEVRYAYGEHVSAGVTVDFTTAASGATAPDIAGIGIVM